MSNDAAVNHVVYVNIVFYLKHQQTINVLTNIPFSKTNK